MNKALSLASSCLNTIQRTNGTGGIITATKKITSSGVEVITAVKTPDVSSKSMNRNALLDLMDLGFTQKDAAFFTGMSQSYASKLLHK